MNIRYVRLAAAGLAAALACACASGRAYRTDTWETWTSWNDSYGASELKDDGVYYTLSARQDDTRDEPSDGYAPGLILSKEIPGSRWQLDLEADFNIPPGRAKRFSYGVWIGGDGARPSVGNPSAVFKLVVQRQNGPRPSDDSLIVFPVPGGRFVRLPAGLKVLRFRRDGSSFSVLYSMNRRKFVQALSAESPEAATAPSQKFFMSGFAGGDPEGAWARMKSLKLDGEEMLY